MKGLELFFSEIWPALVGIGLVQVILWLSCRHASDGYLPFAHPRSFDELALFEREEQKRLYRHASKAALRDWRSIMPFLAFALLMALGIAIGFTLPRVTPIPNSLWVRVALTALIVTGGHWFVTRLARNCVRPYLRELIGKTGAV